MRHGDNQKNPHSDVVSVALVALTEYIGNFNAVFPKLLKIGISFASNIVGAIIAFAILQKVADKVKWNNKGFTLLSKRSMTVYLLHQQIIYFFIYWLNGVVHPYLHAAINFAGSLAISLAIAHVLMKIPFARYLIGEK